MIGAVLEQESEAPARDVLAAEEFAVPAPDPSLAHGPVALPGDPSGIAEAHDVLAAEEFAIPSYRSAAVSDRSAAVSGAQRSGRAGWALRVAVGAPALAALLRLGRKRRRRRVGDAS